MFAEQIIAFSENLENLRDFVATVSSFLEEKAEQELKGRKANLVPFILAMNKLRPDDFLLDEETASRMEELFGEKVTLKLVENGDLSSGRIEFEFEGDGAKRFSDAMKVFNAVQHRRESVTNNALISLISAVEWFLSQLIHKHYTDNPAAIGGKEKQFSLEELARFENISDARAYLIEKKVESVLRGSIEEWIYFLRNDLKLSMSYIDEYKSHLVEAAQRRNLLVHNGGVVNRIYISNFPKTLGDAPKIGEKVSVNEEYLDETISVIERCFLLIASELWKKLGANNEERGKLLINLSYERLLSERYDVAESLSYFASGDKSLIESDQLYAKVNYWIAKKYGSGFEQVRDEIVSVDFSAKDPLFRMAKKILLGEFEDANNDIIYLLEHDDKFTLEEVKVWPLFKEFRDSAIYVELLSKYGHDEIPQV